MRAHSWDLRILLLMISILGLLFATIAWGQAITSGVLLGTITDSSGAVVLDARIAVTNIATGQERQTVTSSGGGGSSGGTLEQRRNPSTVPRSKMASSLNTELRFR